MLECPRDTPVAWAYLLPSSPFPWGHLLQPTHRKGVLSFWGASHGGTLCSVRNQACFHSSQGLTFAARKTPRVYIWINLVKSFGCGSLRNERGSLGQFLEDKLSHHSWLRAAPRWEEAAGAKGAASHATQLLPEADRLWRGWGERCELRGQEPCLPPGRHFRGGSVTPGGSPPLTAAPHLRPSGTSWLLLQTRDHQTSPGWDSSFPEMMDYLPVPVYLP